MEQVRWSVRTLGAVEVVGDGQTLALGGARISALFCLLALEPGRRYRTEVLIDMLEEGGTGRWSASTVRAYISRLRTRLAPTDGAVDIPDADDFGYRLEVRHSDHVQFRRLLSEGESAVDQERWADALAAVEEALALWRGEPFADVDLPAIEPDRAALAILGNRAEDLRCELLVLTGQHERAIDALSKAVAERPLHEQLTHGLALALYRSGRQAESLRVIDRLRGNLAESGLNEPVAEIRQLEQQLLAQDPALEWNPPGQPNSEVTTDQRRAELPTPMDSFVGNWQTVDQVRSLLQDPLTRIITLTGPGGVGKSRIALEVMKDHPGRVWFVPLANVSDAALVLATIRSAIGAPHGPGRTHLESLVDLIGNEPAVLALDNMEQIIEAGDAVLDLLRRCRHLKLLITSRSALRLRGEVEVIVSPLQTQALSGERSSAAATLFLERARSRGVSEERLTDQAAIEKICAALDGLPLAIELAAARIRILGAAEMVRHLDNVLDLLRSAGQDNDHRHSSMRAALEASLRLLGDGSCRTFVALGAVAGGAPLALVQRLTGENFATALDFVQELEEAHLVRVVPGDGMTDLRVELLEVTRAYASELLSKSSDRDAATMHLVKWAEDLVQEFKGIGWGPALVDWLQTLDQEHANLRLAAEAMIADQSQVGDAMIMIASLWRYWELRGHWVEGTSWLTACLDSGGGDARERSEAHKALGILLRSQGELDEAETQFDLAFEWYRSANDSGNMANCLNNKANLRFDQADFEGALAEYLAVNEIGRTFQDPRVELLLLMNSGLASIEAGMLRQGLGYLRKARSRAIDLDNIADQALVEDHLGRTLTLSGYPNMAIPFHERAIGVRLLMADAPGLTFSYAALAEAWLLIGRIEMGALLLGHASHERGRLGMVDVPYAVHLMGGRTRILIERVGGDRARELLAKGALIPSATIKSWFEHLVEAARERVDGQR